MFIFLIVCILFFVLVCFGAQKEESKKLMTFQALIDVSPDQTPELTLYQREKQRRRLMAEVFKLGFYSREALERKQTEEQCLMQRPYQIK